MKEWEKVNKTLQEVSKERDELWLENQELRKKLKLHTTEIVQNCQPSHFIGGAMWDDLTDEQRAKLVEAVEECCGDMYWCRRVWSAWSYGTMGKNDFVPADSCEDFLIDVAKSVLDRASKIGVVDKLRTKN